MTTEKQETIIRGEVGDAVVGAPIPPAPGAEEQKPNPPPEGEAPPEAAEETTEQAEAKRQSRFQRRLDRQKAGRVAAETEARLLRERVAELEERQKRQPDTGEPAQKDGESLEDYADRLADFRAEKKREAERKTEREQRQQQEGRAKATADQEKLAREWTEREKAFEAETKDYQKVVTAYLDGDIEALSDQARRAILESEVGPGLLHHLATHPDVADRIADLSPMRQVIELGKLEDGIKVPAPKKTSSAPAPANTVKPGQSAGSGYRENMSEAEYREWRKGQGARWAR